RLFELARHLPPERCESEDLPRGHGSLNAPRIGVAGGLPMRCRVDDVTCAEHDRRAQTSQIGHVDARLGLRRLPHPGPRFLQPVLVELDVWKTKYARRCEVLGALPMHLGAAFVDVLR